MFLTSKKGSAKINSLSQAMDLTFVGGYWPKHLFTIFLHVFLKKQRTKCIRQNSKKC